MGISNYPWVYPWIYPWIFPWISTKKSVDMDVDVDGEFHIHGKPGRQHEFKVGGRSAEGGGVWERNERGVKKLQREKCQSKKFKMQVSEQLIRGASDLTGRKSALRTEK